MPQLKILPWPGQRELSGGTEVFYIYQCRGGGHMGVNICQNENKRKARPLPALEMQVIEMQRDMVWWILICTNDEFNRPSSADIKAKINALVPVSPCWGQMSNGKSLAEGLQET